jgi:hypothetical protein
MPESTLRTNFATHFGTSTRSPESKPASLPGPLQYDPEPAVRLTKLPKSPTVVFPQSKRATETGQEASPGPNQYGVLEASLRSSSAKRSPAVKFTTAKRW